MSVIKNSDTMSSKVSSGTFFVCVPEDRPLEESWEADESGTAGRRVCRGSPCDRPQRFCTSSVRCQQRLGIYRSTRCPTRQPLVFFIHFRELAVPQLAETHITWPASPFIGLGGDDFHEL